MADRMVAQLKVLLAYHEIIRDQNDRSKGGPLIGALGLP